MDYDIDGDALELFRCMGRYLAKYGGFPGDGGWDRADALMSEDGEVIAILQWHLRPVHGVESDAALKRLLSLGSPETNESKAMTT